MEKTSKKEELDTVSTINKVEDFEFETDNFCPLAEFELTGDAIQELGVNEEREIYEKQKKAFEQFQMKWMLEHGYSLKDLVSALDTYANESDDKISIDDIFFEWERNSGFNSEIWPCFDEFLDIEYQEQMARAKKCKGCKYFYDDTDNPCQHCKRSH